MATFWSNDKGELLVNGAGAPFYADSCCCLNSYYCWRKWVTSFVSAGVITCIGAAETGSWTTPVNNEAQCTEDKDTAPDGMAGGVWRGQAISIRYQWVLGGHYKGQDKCQEKCRADGGGTVPSSPTYIPECCAQGAGAVYVEPPYYTLAIENVHMEGWHINTEEEKKTDPRESFYVRGKWCPIFDAADPQIPIQPGDPSIDKTICGETSTRVAKIYLNNFMEGKLGEPEGFCPEEGEAWQQWSQTRYDAHHRTFSSHVIAGAADTYANGVYVDMYGSNISARNAIHDDGRGNRYWLVDDTLYGFYVDQNGGAASSVVDYGERQLKPYDYSVIFEPGWTQEFAADQWGYMNMVVRGNLHWFLLRECRGASCVKQDVVVYKQEGVGGDTLHGAGSPLWYYRTYITTDFSLPTSNVWNTDYLCMSENVDYPVDLGQTARMAKEFCPTYYYLSDVEIRPVCRDESYGKYCSPTWVSEVVRSTTAPQVYPYNSFVIKGTSSTCWMHRRATNGADRYETFDPTKHASALKMTKLTIVNYPDWYINNQCAGELDAFNGYIPQMDFTNVAWYCAHCTEPTGEEGCVWPEKYRAKDEHTHDCSYPGKWAAVPAVDHIDNGGTDDTCLCVGSPIGKTDECVVVKKDDGNYVWYAKDEPLYRLCGCPDWNMVPYGYCIEYISSFCYWTSRHDDGTYTSHMLGNGKPSSRITVDPYPALERRNMWQGCVSDPASCVGGKHSSYAVHTGPSSYVNEGEMKVTSVISCGFQALQYPQWCCEDTETAARQTYHALEYKDIAAQLSSTARLVLLGYDKCAWSALDENDVISYGLGATVYWTHYEKCLHATSTYEDGTFPPKGENHISNVIAYSAEHTVIASSEMTSNIVLTGATPITFTLPVKDKARGYRSLMEDIVAIEDTKDPTTWSYYSSVTGAGATIMQTDDPTERTAQKTVRRAYDDTKGQWVFIIDAYCPDVCDPGLPAIPEKIIHYKRHWEEYTRADTTKPWTCITNETKEEDSDYKWPTAPKGDDTVWDVISGEGYDNDNIMCGKILPISGQDTPEGADICWTRHTNNIDTANCIASNRQNWDRAWKVKIDDTHTMAYSYHVVNETYASDYFSVQYVKRE